MSNVTIIDRRSERRRSSPNRERLLRRIKGSIKKAIPNVIGSNSIRDMGKDGKNISIPVKGLNEPLFQHDEVLGKRQRVFSGNDQFAPGDRINRPLTDGKATEGSDDPSIGEDEFVVSLTPEEFAIYFFEDLELPDLIKKQLSNSIEDFRMRHAGFIAHGIPSRLNIIRSFKNSLGRRLAITTQWQNEIDTLELKICQTDDDEEAQRILKKIEKLKKQIETIPFFVDVDLRYDHYIKEPVPITKAVMICPMDVSGSMGQEEKDIAKRFYMFLYLFLESQYKHVDIVWIRHHTTAKRVDEDEFFNSQETGGTIVSSALELAHNIKTNGDVISVGGYPTDQWNIYFAQCTDGDNTYSDANKCHDLLRKIMQYTQYYAYIQIRSPGEQNLWEEYLPIAEAYPNFVMRHINAKNEIWQVFQGLFQKQEAAIL